MFARYNSMTENSTPWPSFKNEEKKDKPWRTITRPVAACPFTNQDSGSRRIMAHSIIPARVESFLNTLNNNTYATSA